MSKTPKQHGYDCLHCAIWPAIHTFCDAHPDARDGYDIELWHQERKIAEFKKKE